MRQSRFTDSQILTILKQVEAGAPVTDLCCESSVISATLCVLPDQGSSTTTSYWV